VLLSNVITIVAMFIPFIDYSFFTTLLAFGLLGIANTILQVSLNPLITNVINDEKLLTSNLTAGQFIKALSSFSAPFIAAFVAVQFGNWQYIFPIYALLTLLSTIWLLFTPIPEDPISEKASSYGSVFSLLKDKTIFLLFTAILFVVGVDVGVNTAASKILMERVGLNSIQAGYGPSVYFALRTLGTFLGAFLLSKVSTTKFYRVTISVALLALLVLIFSTDKLMLFILFGIIGFTIANIFPIIYGMAIQKRPEKANEISGLMITGVFGGAILPFFMGISSDLIGSQIGSVIVLIIGVLYLLYAAFSIRT